MIEYTEPVKFFRTLRYGKTYFNEAYERGEIDVIIEWQYAKRYLFSEPFYTLCIDLTQSKDIIFAQFAKNTKYKINRAIKQDGIETADMTPAKEAFYTFFDEFAMTKKLNRIDRNDIDRLIEHQMFVIRAALYKHEPVVYHTYIIANGRTRLAQSASLFRKSAEPDLRSVIGRANRLLHWEDICYFKDLGYSVYDLGGINTNTANKETLSINNFKECFGGTEVREYKSLIPVSIKGYMYLFYKWIIGKIAY
ncbi:hypothetical protein [Treponema endosymbiont of Eucomonympha sp.]|uniref:hypothetical protein n=1 Tax=Treponema endosymbiont of Eucomonympha sp. TaxID=1580831 RepID=UPI0007839A2B|nr:hypothetical protein [Treponema endosymbiont of Eucomonympha sp.]